MPVPVLVLLTSKFRYTNRTAPLKRPFLLAGEFASPAGRVLVVLVLVLACFFRPGTLLSNQMTSNYSFWQKCWKKIRMLEYMHCYFRFYHVSLTFLESLSLTFLSYFSRPVFPDYKSTKKNVQKRTCKVIETCKISGKINQKPLWLDKRARVCYP